MEPNPITYNSMLISFDMIVDTDFGILNAIKNEYNASIFDKSIFNNSDERIKLYLIERKGRNPLTYVASDRIDEMYDKIMEEDYQTVLKYSCFTALYEFVNLTSIVNRAKIAILCRNLHEKQYIKESFRIQNVSSIEIIDKLDVDYSKYDSIFMKYKEDVLDNKYKLNLKSVYLAKAGYNLKETDSGGLQIDGEMYKEAMSNGIVVNLIDLYNVTEEYTICG